MELMFRRRSRKVGPVILGFGLGALMPFAYAPYGYAWLGVLALSGWLALARSGYAGWVGLAFGVGWFGTGAWWLAPTFHLYGGLPYVVAAFCVLLVGLALGAFPALWMWATQALTRQDAWLLVTFPVLAVGEEWLRGHLFTGLPWTALGDLVLGTPAVGWAAWVGVYGATLLPALAAAALALIWRGAYRWGGIGVLVVLVLVLVAPKPYAADGPQRQAALVQANIPQDEKWDAAFLNDTMERYARLSAQAATAHPDLIIWPEAAVPFFLSRAPDWNAWLQMQIRAWNAPLVFGGLKLMADGEHGENGVFLAMPDGTRSFVGKQHLVPFGEYVPSWLPFLHTLVPAIAQWTPGTGKGVLRGPHGILGILVCYESIFPEQARERVQAGANVLINVTNDAWYGHSPAAWQHMQAARMRAVETGRYVLRAANTGVSVIIAPDGRITATRPWWTEGLVRGTYRVSDRITPYVRWGDTPLSAGFVLLALAVWFDRRRR
jgi:apolipoprotein N-acyltransferase